MNDHVLSENLGKYLDYLIKKPDRKPPPYLKKLNGWECRTPTELYIEPDVVPESAVVEAGADLDFGPTSFVPNVAAVSWHSKALGLFRHRRCWRNCWRPVWESNTPWRCLVVAKPGHGKSSLVAMTARCLAQEGQALLEDSAAIASVPIPVVITPEVITDFVPHPDKSADAGLRMLIRKILRPAGIDSDTARYIAQRADDRRTWLMLDGIDQFPPDKLKWLFNTIENWNCRVLVTSRPNDPALSSVPHEHVAYRLCSFAYPQIFDLVSRWFSDPADLPSKNQLLGLLPQLGGASNPRFLAIICQHWQTRQPPTSFNVTDLFEEIVSNAIGLSASESEHPHKQRAAEWFPTLAEVMWHFLTADDGFGGISAERLLDVIARSIDRPSLRDHSSKETANLTARQQAHELIKELTQKGLLFPRDAGTKTFTVVDRAVAEYLVARGLASAIENGGNLNWGHSDSPAGNCVPINPWDFVDAKAIDPTWSGVLVYLAGRLRYPFPLFELLLNWEKDDLLGHRVAIAGACFNGVCSELLGALKERFQKMAMLIAGSLLNRPFVAPVIYSLYPVFYKPLLAIARQFPRETIELCLSRLSTSNRTERDRAFIASALLAMTPPAILPDVGQLRRGLFRRFVCFRSVVGEVGAFTERQEMRIFIFLLSKTSDVESELAACLHDDDPSVACSAFRAAEEFNMVEQRDRMLTVDQLARLQERLTDFREEEAQWLALLSEKDIAHVREFEAGISRIISDYDRIFGLLPNPMDHRDLSCFGVAQACEAERFSSAGRELVRHYMAELQGDVSKISEPEDHPNVLWQAIVELFMFGESFLSLNMFFEFFPTFPARLVLAYPADIPKVLSVAGLFKHFGGSWVKKDYDWRFREYVEPSTQNVDGQGSLALFGRSSQEPPTTFGVIYHRVFERGGGYVLHNHPINPDHDGFRMFWINKAGQQLVMETLDGFLDSIDAAAPGGNGWSPEPAPAPEVEMNRGRKTEAEVETATEAEAETETACEYEVCA